MVRTTRTADAAAVARPRSGASACFSALSPLWIAVNGADTADSPYRRMMVLNGAAVRSSGRSPVSDAAATLGITPAASRALAGAGAARRGRHGHAARRSSLGTTGMHRRAPAASCRSPYPANPCWPPPNASTGISAPTLTGSGCGTTSRYGPARRRSRIRIRFESAGASAMPGVPMRARVSGQLRTGWAVRSQ